MYSQKFVKSECRIHHHQNTRLTNLLTFRSIDKSKIWLSDAGEIILPRILTLLEKGLKYNLKKKGTNLQHHQNDRDLVIIYLKRKVP
jgi:hypothetical protein